MSRKYWTRSLQIARMAPVVRAQSALWIQIAAEAQDGDSPSALPKDCI
jgi:hypothetical protein